jgi:hypothetical protein
MRQTLKIVDLLTLKKDKNGKLLFALGPSEYSFYPSKETLDSIDKDLSTQIKGDDYVHDATAWCMDILKEIRKSRKQAK